MRYLVALTTISAAFAMTAPAADASSLHFDLDHVATTKTAVFGDSGQIGSVLSFSMLTGAGGTTLDFSSSDGYHLTGSQIVVDSISGSFTLNNANQITGGTFSLSAHTVSYGTDGYSFDIAMGNYNTLTIAGTLRLYQTVITQDGDFSGNTFLGYDVSAGYDNDLAGRITNFSFKNGLTDFDIYVDLPETTVGAAPAVPLPAALWGGLSLMGVLGARRALRKK